MSYFCVPVYHCLPVLMFSPVISAMQVPCLPLLCNIIISEIIINCSSFTWSKINLSYLVWDLSILPFLGTDPPTMGLGGARCQLRESLTGHCSPGRAAPGAQSPMTSLSPSPPAHIRAHPKYSGATKLQEGWAPVHRVQTPLRACSKPSSKPRPSALRLLCRQTPCGQQAHLHMSN